MGRRELWLWTTCILICVNWTVSQCIWRVYLYNTVGGWHPVCRTLWAPKLLRLRLNLEQYSDLYWLFLSFFIALIILFKSTPYLFVKEVSSVVAVYEVIYCSRLPASLIPGLCYCKVTPESAQCCLKRELLWTGLSQKSMCSIQSTMKFLMKNGNIMADRTALQYCHNIASPS